MAVIRTDQLPVRTEQDIVIARQTVQNTLIPEGVQQAGIKVANVELIAVHVGVERFEQP